MSLVIRACLVLIGLAVMLAGIVAIVVVPAVGIAGLWWVAMGGLLVVAVVAERQRYRSVSAEKVNAPTGPGGGETPGTEIEPRFRSTSEVFIDPTTGHRMRVLVDPASGERRYVAEA